MRTLKWRGAVGLIAAAALALPAVAEAAPKSCGSRRTPCVVADTTAPVVAIVAPSSGATVSGTVTVSGTASDNVGLARVELAVDGGPLQLAAGTSSWSASLDTTRLLDGGHSLAARATDTSGNVQTTSVSVVVSNPVPDTTAPAVVIATPAPDTAVAGIVSVAGSASDDRGVASVQISVDGGAWSPAAGTTSWSASVDTAAWSAGTHTIQVRAGDVAGNSTTATVTVTVAAPSSTPPPADGVIRWVSPEGATIEIDSAGPWTVEQVYKMLRENADAPGDFARIAPTLTVKVQDVYTSQAVTAASMSAGRYTDFQATIYLKGVSSTFEAQPDAVLGHEYGHVWTLYHLYVSRQGDWTSYLDYRGLAGNTSLDSSYNWSRSEIIADDYRLLFGSAAAVTQRPNHLNPYIADPRDVPGLKNFFSATWATAAA